VSDPADLDYCYLTTTGRITGSPHRIEIWFALREQTLYLLAGDGERSDWIRNLMVSSDVVVELGNRRRTTRARVVEAGTEEDALARRLLFEKYSERGNTDLEDWAATALPVAIEWPTATTYTSLI
jgi:deazaflavin-dependent oxidoreductase (nitroreductase family)